MKCPLFVIGDMRVQLGEETEYGDCLKEECAWWEVYIGACSIRVLAADIARETRERERRANYDNR